MPSVRASSHLASLQPTPQLSSVISCQRYDTFQPRLASPCPPTTYCLYLLVILRLSLSLSLSLSMCAYVMYVRCRLLLHRPLHAGGLLLHRRPVGRYFTRVTVRLKDITTSHFEEERVGTPFPLLKCLRTHKTHLKLRKKNKNALRLFLTLCQTKSCSSVDSYENH